jgi:hypothetical protein
LVQEGGLVAYLKKHLSEPAKTSSGSG